MDIICPECQFSRQVDETKIPARSQVATCPKCQTKFQFRDLPEEEPTEPVEQKASTPAPEHASVQKTLPDMKPEQQAESLGVEDVAPEQNTQPTAPSEPTFPPLAAPGEDPKEGLWDKLDSMTPPDSTVEAPVETPHQSDQAQLPVHDNEQQAVPGWTGEFSDDFPDPMQDDPNGDEEDEHLPLVPPPFEQLDRYGFFHGLYMTVKLVLTSPRLFFAVMPVGGGLAKPLTFTILLTMMQGFVQYFWGMAGLSVSVGPDGTDAIGGVSNALAPILMLLFMPAFIAAGQFIITGIYHLMLILMKADNKGFEGTFRALAYANAPIILGIFPMPVAEIEIVWMLIAAIWGLFLTITGLKQIHQTSYAKVIPVCIVPLLLAMIAGLMVFQGAVSTI